MVNCRKRQVNSAKALVNVDKISPQSVEKTDSEKVVTFLELVVKIQYLFAWICLDLVPSLMK